MTNHWKLAIPLLLASLLASPRAQARVTKTPTGSVQQNAYGTNVRTRQPNGNVRIDTYGPKGGYKGSTTATTSGTFRHSTGAYRH